MRMKKMAPEIAREEERKAKARELAGAVLTLLKARGIPVDDATRSEIEKIEESGELEEMLVRAATAENAAAVLARP